MTAQKLFLSCLTALLFFNSAVFAQLTTSKDVAIKGTLVDSISKQPVSFATILLYSNEKRIAGASSDQNGLFSLKNIEAGNYTLATNYLGYKAYTTKLSVIKGKETNLGTILMVPDAKVLSGVTVTARANLIQDKGDKIVYNAEADISNTGGTAIDVLRKTPMLSVDASGNVQMLGSSSIKVLLNGKPSNILARNLADALKMIPANSIKSIEVVTSPSAKYDAEGTGGVINIITKKNLQGSNGNVALTHGNRNNSINGGYSLKGEKFGVNLSGYYGQYINEAHTSFERINFSANGQDSILQNNNFRNTGKGWNGDLGITYDADSLNLFSFSITNWGSVDPNQTSMFSKQTSLNPPDREYRQDVDYKNPFGNISANLAYTKHFKRPQQELAFISQYSTTYDDYRYTTNRFNMINELSYKEISRNKSNSDEWTIQTDYTHPFDTAGRKSFETGAKAIIRKVNSDYEVQDTQEDIENIQINPSRSNVFDYTQRVLAAYGSFKLNTKSGWMILVGGRLEHTFMNGNFQSVSSSFEQDYFNLIPSFTISTKINKKHTLKATYTQRISRPQVWNLNPYVVTTDPKNLWTGNPELRPELSHASQLGYNVSFKGGLNLNTSLYWRQANNSIQYVSKIGEGGISTAKPENSGKQIRQGASANLSADLTKKWNFSSNADFCYTKLSNPGENLSNEGWFYYANLNTSYKLPKKYTIQLYSNYNSGWLWLQGKNSSNYYYTGSLKKEFLKDKASITLNVDNPFKSHIRMISNESAYNTTAHTKFNTRRVNDYMNRSYRLSFNWQFGKMSQGKERSVKKVNNDDAASR